MRNKLGLTFALFILILGCSSVTNPDEKVKKAITPYLQDALDAAYPGSLEIKSAKEIYIIKKSQDVVFGNKVYNVCGYFYGDFMSKVENNFERVKPGDIKNGIVVFFAKVTQEEGNMYQPNAVKIEIFNFIDDKTRDNVNKSLEMMKKIDDKEFQLELAKTYDKDAFIIKPIKRK